MSYKLILFDIDGTILFSGGAGARAIDRVFMDLFGLPDAFAGIKPDGMIDTGIFREILVEKKVAVPDIEQAVEQVKPRYIEAIREEMPSSPAELLPGYPQLLDLLSDRDDVALGLVTGNLEQGARIKLNHFDLNRYFPFGAFGSDSDDRPALVRLAHQRAMRHLERILPLNRDVIVIGDTPKDVACALENGATAVGVATNKFTREMLLDSGAHLAFDDFSEPEQVVATLLGE